MQILAFFRGLTLLGKLVSALVLILSIVLPIYITKCKRVQDAKGIAKKEKTIKRENEKKIEKKVEVYDENQKEKIEAVETVEKAFTRPINPADHKEALEPGEEPPSDEELQDVRERVLDNFRGGLPE